MASLNTVVFLVLVLSMLMGAEETGRWKVVAVAIASILVQASLRELLPGMFGAIVSVIVTVIFVGTALVTWCEIERPLPLPKRWMNRFTQGVIALDPRRRRILGVSNEWFLALNAGR